MVFGDFMNSIPEKGNGLMNIFNQKKLCVIMYLLDLFGSISAYISFFLDSFSKNKPRYIAIKY